MIVSGVNSFEELASAFPPHLVVTESTVGIFKINYGMIRYCRPSNVVELGSHTGQTSAFMMLALRENGAGFYAGYEKAPAYARAAEELCDRLLPNWRSIGRFEVGDFYEREDRSILADFVFVDIEPKQRYMDAFRKINPLPGCTVLAHDATHPGIGSHVMNFRRQLMDDGWTTLVFPQERGLVVARKENP